MNFANGVVENDPNGITVHIQNDGGVISNRRADFNGQGGLSSQYFIGAYYGTKLRISVTFTESTQGTFGDQTLVSQSSINGEDRSIIISVNRQTSQVSFALTAGDTFSSVSVSFNGAVSCVLLTHCRLIVNLSRCINYYSAKNYGDIKIATVRPYKLSFLEHTSYTARNLLNVLINRLTDAFCLFRRCVTITTELLILCKSLCLIFSGAYVILRST